MPAVDFGEWAAVDGLDLTLGGNTYTVPPPSVRSMRQILAAAVRAEVNLGLVKGEIPPEVQAVLDDIGPDEHPALGPVYDQLAAAGTPQVVVDRMAYYAVFYWARGKAYADALARALWEPTATAEGSSEPAPKG
ncbi:hypothetical protein [Cellulomonas sp. ES6]|uniref:DUF7426 family protein n=1 Tax=Cellulomonas sp. ES6 TaxID=3039384 RepID=UPI0024B6CF45|nr:hypothetical protein [Cellulomonas sp. ES6]WHP18839.1 hypothetical protein P9841_06900 [Cellulomonas sp. ES6]